MLIWRRDDHHPRLPELAEAFAAAGCGSRRLEAMTRVTRTRS
jgi:hypothetical protein